MALIVNKAKQFKLITQLVIKVKWLKLIEFNCLAVNQNFTH